MKVYKTEVNHTDDRGEITDLVENEDINAIKAC